jgi:hypothetical protein
MEHFHLDLPFFVLIVIRLVVRDHSDVRVTLQSGCMGPEIPHATCERQLAIAGPVGGRRCEQCRG